MKRKKPIEAPSRRKIINPLFGDEFSVSSRSGDQYVVTLLPNLILMRPKGSRRRGPAEVALVPGAVYIPALRSRIASEKSAKKRKGGAR